MWRDFQWRVEAQRWQILLSWLIFIQLSGKIYYPELSVSGKFYYPELTVYGDPANFTICASLYNTNLHAVNYTFTYFLKPHNVGISISTAYSILVYNFSFEI